MFAQQPAAAEADMEDEAGQGGGKEEYTFCKQTDPHQHNQLTTHPPNC